MRGDRRYNKLFVGIRLAVDAEEEWLNWLVAREQQDEEYTPQYKAVSAACDKLREALENVHDTAMEIEKAEQAKEGA